MQNFGRGMWRRVGDYDRLYVPDLVRSAQLQQYAAYLEYKESINRQLAIDEYRKQMIAKTRMETNSVSIPETKSFDSSKEDETIVGEEIVAVETEIPNAPRPVKEPTILPRRGRKKNGYK
jgi:hypothetical protein